MSTLLFFVGAAAISMAALAALRSRDPKRLRVFRASGTPSSRSLRVLLWSAFLAPGLGLLMLGQASAFLSWSGAVLVAGWILAARPAAALES
ncbi:MAG: hypothetical protein AAGE01_05515 [Pseudomonadota bacterium]